MGDDPVAAILDRAKSLSAEKDREVGGKTYHSLLMDTGKRPDLLRLFIDPQTNLLQRIEGVPRPGAAKQASQRIVRWEAGIVTTAPLPTDMFNPKPKDGAHQLRVINGETYDLTAMAQQQVREADYRRRLVGKPVPDFTLEVLGNKRTTRHLAKSELAGKVVLIDFWATWCGSCLEELPHLCEIAERYAERDDLMIIALSQDEKPADRDELRELVEKTLARREVDLGRRNNGLVAVDPTHVVGKAFEVYALPTTILLDRRGIVRTVEVGMRRPYLALPVTADGGRLSLAEEIDRLLSHPGPPVADPDSIDTPQNAKSRP
jgi:thiol-disulfide isomerase/thioredoxin